MTLLLKKMSLPLASFELQADLEFSGRCTAIFGPSGAGKTSLLDLIAGLRRPASAFIQLNDDVMTDTSRGLFIPAKSRGIGYVPQDLALFPHLSVRQNLLYGFKTHGMTNGSIGFDRIVDLLEIRGLLARSTTSLSGGERQRVALARALLAAPRLLLLDEPLANLDLKLKARIVPYLVRIRDEFKIPILYVTHDRFETLALADQMVILADGRIVQHGSVQDVFSRPASIAVAGLLAVETIQPGRIQTVENGLISVSVGETTLSALDENLPPGVKDVHVCIRAENVILAPSDSPGSARNHLPGVVQSLLQEGPLTRVDVDCGFTLAVLLTRQACEELALKPGQKVVALVKAPHIHLIPR
jgi:molybdate transport system ATP-binding protein